MDRDRTSEKATPDALNEAIEKLMAHPELISMVASALGNNAPPSTGEKPKSDASMSESLPPSIPKKEEASEPTPPSELGNWIATLSPLLSGKGGKQDDPRSCLLRALKPYVNSSRQEAIDTMLRLSQISDVLRHLHS